MSLDSIADDFVARKMRDDFARIRIDEQPPTSVASLKGVIATGPQARPVTADNSVSAMLAQLTSYIPTEIVAAYIAVISIIPIPRWATDSPSAETCTFAAPAPSSTDFWLWLTVAIGAVLSPAIVYLLARAKTLAAGGTFVTPLFPIIASILAFGAWVVYLPHSIVAHCLSIPAYGGAIIVVLVTLGLYVVNLILTPRSGAVPNVPDIPLPNEIGRGDGDGGEVVSTERTEPGPPPQDVVLQGSSLVLTNPEISIVFVGSFWNEGDGVSMRNACDQFVDDYLRGDAVSSLSVYGVRGATRLGSMTVDGFAQPLIKDSDLQDMLGRLLQGGTIAVNDNTLVAFVTPPGLRIDATDANHAGITCRDCCGYHFVAHSVPYAVIPFPDCDLCRRGKPLLDAVLTEIVHELCDAMTNPVLFEGGFVSPTGQEISDNCQDHTVMFGGHNIQPVWINGRGCV